MENILYSIGVRNAHGNVSVEENMFQSSVFICRASPDLKMRDLLSRKT